MFEESLTDKNIRIISTKDFRQSKLIGHPSSFYPVFVNLTDNSIYWLSNQKNKKREIHLEKDKGSFIFSDNGPGISLRNQEKIFKYGFSTKPFGRGLGLYISQKVLEKEGYFIKLLDSDDNRGATFKIGPILDNF